MNQGEKSEAQLRNEEVVRRIMAERGYSRAQKKKKKFSKKFFILPAIAVVVIVSAVVVPMVMNKKEDENDNNNVEHYSNEQIETSENNSNNQMIEEANDGASASGNHDTQYTPSSDDTYEDLNVYYSHSDEDGTQHYTDGSTYNPHRCDALYEKYNNAKSEAERLKSIWDDALKNWPSFSELFDRAGGNLELANLLAEQEEQKVDEAYKNYLKSKSKADAIYDDEIIPCRKEM